MLEGKNHAFFPPHVQDTRSFARLAIEDRIYQCDDQLDGRWSAVTSTIRIRFCVEIIESTNLYLLSSTFKNWDSNIISNKTSENDCS